MLVPLQYHDANEYRRAAVFRKILLSDGFHVYFVGIRSLFSFILLTYNFAIMLCIDIGYTRHCVGGSFLFFYHPKKVKKRILVVTKEHAKFQQNVSSVNFVDTSYHSFITTRQNNLHN